MATPSKEKAAVEAAEAEAAGKDRSITFGEGDSAVTFELPRKWKRFKFSRALARGDIAACLDSIWPPSREEDPVTGQMVDKPHPVVEQIEELDVDGDEFTAALDRLGHALAGTSAGNSSSSPA